MHYPNRSKIVCIKIKSNDRKHCKYLFWRSIISCTNKINCSIIIQIIRWGHWTRHVFINERSFFKVGLQTILLTDTFWLLHGAACSSCGLGPSWPSSPSTISWWMVKLLRRKVIPGFSQWWQNGTGKWLENELVY